MEKIGKNGFGMFKSTGFIALFVFVAIGVLFCIAFINDAMNSKRNMAEVGRQSRADTLVMNQNEDALVIGANEFIGFVMFEDLEVEKAIPLFASSELSGDVIKFEVPLYNYDSENLKNFRFVFFDSFNDKIEEIIMENSNNGNDTKIFANLIFNAVEENLASFMRAPVRDAVMKAVKEDPALYSLHLQYSLAQF